MRAYHNWRDIEIPRSMRVLPKDDRGYPIPFIVYRDKRNGPQFSINDFASVRICRNNRLCGICGRRMDDGLWFVGGLRCFTHENGAFVDPPSHEECATYALQVCPFLAAPSYARRIDDRKVQETPVGATFVKETMMPDAQPTLFGLGQTDRYETIFLSAASIIMAVHRWNFVEWWKNGERVNAPTPEEFAP